MTAQIFDRLLMSLIAATLLASVVITLFAPEYFHLTFAAEDRLVENGTALFLLLACLVLLRNTSGLAGRGLYVGSALTAFYALLFFFASGEEISWGQRIFGWETTEFFAENNYQGETNLHNLMVGEHRLARTLFGNVLTTVLLLYLVALPLLWSRVALVRRLSDALFIPVPGPRHAAAALIGSLVIAVLDVPRKWEVYELVFAILATSIFLLPQNRERIR
ncbi:hypothetical protein [uncultured Roseovarius sp.]|uniref:hypothetical protein n=1 Tax=uncultured Roseovarius sp. TaxID=293344 RepID=UPI002631BA23|nr:hypothetical protein [uncultured Roseovarius sp.]